MSRRRYTRPGGLAVTVLVAGCSTATSGGSEPAGSPSGASEGPRIVQPGAPGEASRVLDRGDLAELEGVTHSAADVRFMRRMIPHHAQALDMVDLVWERTDDDVLRALARRIEISQRDEIVRMERWLRSRGEPVEPPGAHDHGALMPGMLTPEEMEDLASKEGEAFERAFLSYMIKHHEGALAMVEELFGTPGGGQTSAMYTFASHVEADQQMEIGRMRSLLAEERR